MLQTVALTGFVAAILLALMLGPRCPCGSGDVTKQDGKRVCRSCGRRDP
jgi:hypothetical protein